jgi:hypothetical protein
VADDEQDATNSNGITKVIILAFIH